MSLVYNEEQKQLQDSARDYLAARASVAQQRRLRDEGVALGFDDAAWRGMLDLGWGAVAFPEEVGGLAFGFSGFAPLFEELGRHLSASPLLSSVVLCGSLIEALGSDAQRQALLPALISGERRLALALEERPLHAPEQVALLALDEADDYVLAGSKCWVPDAREADAFLTIARLESGELALFLVPADAEGLHVTPLDLVDSRNHGAIAFDSVRLPASARIGDGDIGAALARALDRGRACLAAELLGMSERIFEMTLDYLRTRVQFDAPIGSFQALQHRAARLYVELQLARSAVMAAFEALGDEHVDAGERARLASLAKWKMNEAAQRVSNEAVQMHGGIGVTDEYDLGLYLKRIRVAQACLGDTDFHCERYGATLN
jgi:hypothetical protein